MAQHFAPTFREVFRRIGEDASANLLWLRQFAAMPLNHLDESQRIGLMENTHAFCLLASSTSPTVWRKLRLPDFELVAMHSPAIFRKRWREIESLQVMTHDAVFAAAMRQPLRLPKLKMELEIDFSKWSVADVRPSSPQFWIVPPIRVDESWEGAFIYRLAGVLGVEGDRLGQCPSLACKQPLRLFLRTKSDQLFCSNTCRSREAMKKLRQQKTERLARAHKKQAKTRNKKGGKHGTQR